MEFTLVREWGDHKIFNFNIQKHKFIEYLQNLYNNDNLNQLQFESEDFKKFNNQKGGLDDRETDLHKIFYNEIKSNNNFKILYCNFVKDIYEDFFPDEQVLIYQSFPSIRLQYSNSVVVPPHCDSDSLGCHPLGEKNFLIPITEMKNTSSVYLESKPGASDFESINMEYGNLLFFNGNKCIHYNMENKEGKLRISFDFRVLTLSDYINYIFNHQVTITNPRDPYGSSHREPIKMLVGGYYQVTFKNEDINSMTKWFKQDNTIMQHRPSFEKEEAESCYQYMLEDTFVTEHRKTAELERMICEKINIRNCLMTTSGTTAIILALMSLDLQPNDEVIVPNYTMIATVNSVKFLGLKPVIVDVDKDTFTLNLDTIKNNITEKTKCVVHVSLNNRYKNIKEIASFCKSNDIYLVEDAAQSLGCKIEGENLGTFGDIGCFSLSTPKIISTGQGGFVVTNNDKLANKMMMMKNFGRKESGKDDFIVFGINLKFTDIQAVIGIEQMKKLDWRVKRLREIYLLYYKRLNQYYEMKKPLSDEWLPWFVDIYTKDRERLVEFMNKHNIKTRPVYGEINKTPVYEDDNVITLENSNYVSTYGLFLPSYITLTDEEINHICNILIIFSLKNCNKQIKLHLGCGEKNFGDDWTHVDGSDYSHTHSHDIVNLPFEENSVDLIYLSHAFEYFNRDEAVNVLAKWRKVLKPGGVLRLAVPDFGACAKLYVNKGVPLSKYVGMFYGKWKMTETETIYHKTLYDFDSLKKLLEDNGFCNVREWNWRHVEHGHIDDYSQAYLPHMDKENGTLISLNIEASK